MHDLEGRLLDANQAWFDLLGYRREEITSLSLLSLLDDGQAQAAREMLGELKDHGTQRTRRDLRLRCKNGDLVDLEVSAALLANDGWPAVLAIARDISERKRREREAARRDESLRKLNRFAADLSLLPAEKDLEAFILGQLLDISGGAGAVFVEFDPAQYALTVVDISLESGLLDKVVGLLGRNVIGMSSRISEALYRDISTQVVRVSKTLHEASFGSAPKTLGTAVEAFLKIDRFVGVAYLVDGGLYGMSVVGMTRGTPDPPMDVLKDFSFLVALALRRKGAETSLRESEERYRLLTESASDVFWTIDTEGSFTYISPSVERLLGYAPEELIGQKVTAALTPESVAGVEDALGMMSAAARSGQPGPEFRRELELPCRDGSTVWAEHRATELRDTSGRWLGFVGVSRDITETKRAAELLRVSEAKYRTVVDNIHEGVIVVSPGRVLYHNAQMAEMLGYAAEELAQVGFEGIHPDDRAAVLEGVASMIEEGAPSPRSEVKLFAKNGDTRIVRTSASAIEWQGEPAVIVFMDDITEQKKAEVALRESQQRYQSLVNLSPDAILVEVDGCYRFANVAAARLFAADSADELIGLTSMERVHPDYREFVAKKAAQITAGATPQAPGEIKVLRMDGSGVDVEVTAAKVDFMGENATQIVHRDITERKRAEARQHDLELQLQERQKLESLGVLAGGIAHDFNNLLTAILGYSDIIIRCGVSSPETTLADVQEIKKAAERAKALTGAILAFSRRQPREPQILSLSDLLAEVEPLLRRTLGEDIEIVSRLQANDCVVEMDPSQFTQVIMNLVVNARDAMPAGGMLTLEVARRHVEKDSDISPDLYHGDWAVLTVSDTGVGIHPGIRSRIFEPFFTTKAPGEGTGLGLSTAYGVVKQSGGDIKVSSELGSGTTFEVYLPCVETSTSESGSPSTEVVNEPESSGAARQVSETVLLVEDEPAVRRLATRVLQEQGYKVLAVPDGSQGLMIAQDHSIDIDLLLTDVVLPGGLRGDEVAREVLRERPDLTVVYMSGYPRADNLGSRRLEEGINYLEKPFTANDLITKLREVLDPGAEVSIVNEAGGGREGAPESSRLE